MGYYYLGDEKPTTCLIEGGERNERHFSLLGTKCLTLDEKVHCHSKAPRTVE